jgi:hypothetical protein
MGGRRVPRIFVWRWDVRERVLEVLEAIREELDNRSDAEYVEGVPRGNWAMKLLGEVDEAIALVKAAR